MNIAAGDRSSSRCEARTRRADRLPDVRARVLVRDPQRAPDSLERPTDDPTVRQPDITLAETELGWAPQIGYEEGLEQTLAYFRSHPELANV